MQLDQHQTAFTSRISQKKMTLSIKIFRLNVILGSVAQLSRSQPSVEMVYFRHDCFFFFVVICIVFFRFAFVFCFLFIFSPLGIDLFG